MNNSVCNSNFDSKRAIDLICEQHTDKLSEGDIGTLKLLDWQSLVNFSLVDKFWNERLKILVSYRKPQVEKHVNLKLFTVLQRCLSENFQDTPHIKKAAQIVESFYETKPRIIKDVKYGLAFPVNPELLHYAMFLAKNETVLEIAGGDGKNAALLAFSRAKHVYMNDIVPEEIKSFKELCDRLPSQVQQKIEPVLGDCFDILKIKPELEGTVGLVLCNNLVHFFNDKKQDDFLNLLKKILKPGGKAILTANSCYTKFPNELPKESLENTAWQSIDCFIQDYAAQGMMPVGSLYSSFVPSKPSNVSCDYQQHYLLLKNKTTDYKWVEDESGYQTLSPVEAKKLKAIVNVYSDKFKKETSLGTLRLLTSVGHHFLEENFAALFKKAGFEVEQTFKVGYDGHLFFGAGPYDEVTKVGIIIKAPEQI